ncbi:VTT domain-containing protein [Desulfurivibrio alkaliphilus]|uniref:TVP38/TMEM64 family membrane protein n=1 Tax=Desulfurivibrio alkaliphilus (strain DSM 19089 / UNIQEM U267 / AHT2) TaxID=589865 RepID=D6Z2I6_DESAT|nr:VTT domain-containing protein [Desulfurivibrio alkaliphilus]ADH85761.1 SNARE associated Golgi protein-related protein [Desulfurivibrio alkaliphilus AHT 2]
MSFFARLTNRTAFGHLRANRNFLLLLIFFAVLPLTVSSLFIYFAQANQHLLTTQTMPALLIFHLAAIPAMALALTPTTFVAIVSGYFFSWYGLAGLLLSYPLAALLGLRLGGAAKALVLSEDFYLNPKIQQFLEQIRRDEFTMIIFTRLSPVLPFAMTNVALSVLKLGLTSFMLGTMIGMLPRTLIFFMLGRDAPEIWAFAQNPSLEGLHRLIPLLLIITSTVGLLWIAQRTLTRMNSQ